MAREGQKMTQTALAEAVAATGLADTSVVQGVISHWEMDSPTRGITLNDVLALESALGLRRGRLLIAGGYVDDVASIDHAITADQDLPERDKDALRASYQAMKVRARFEKGQP